jgi:hypothetical protein
MMRYTWWRCCLSDEYDDGGGFVRRDPASPPCSDGDRLGSFAASSSRCCLTVANNSSTWTLGTVSISSDPSTLQRFVPTLHTHMYYILRSNGSAFFFVFVLTVALKWSEFVGWRRRIRRRRCGFCLFVGNDKFSLRRRFAKRATINKQQFY